MAIKAIEAIIRFLRPTASDNIPINGDIIAMAITVAPTVIPTWVSVAEKACIIIGKIACMDYTCKKANAPIIPIIIMTIKLGAGLACTTLADGYVEDEWRVSGDFLWLDVMMNLAAPCAD